MTAESAETVKLYPPLSDPIGPDRPESRSLMADFSRKFVFQLTFVNYKSIIFS
jgi:hypothetical protein